MAGASSWSARGHSYAAAVKAARLVESTGCTPQEAIDQVLAELKEGPAPVERPIQEPADVHPSPPESGSAPDPEVLARYLIAVARIAGCREPDTLTIQELLDIAEASPMRTIPYRVWIQRREASE